MAKCPKCGKTYNESSYEKIGKCSECRAIINPKFMSGGYKKAESGGELSKRKKKLPNDNPSTQAFTEQKPSMPYKKIEKSEVVRNEPQKEETKTVQQQEQVISKNDVVCEPDITEENPADTIPQKTKDSNPTHVKAIEIEPEEFVLAFTEVEEPDIEELEKKETETQSQEEEEPEEETEITENEINGNIEKGDKKEVDVEKVYKNGYDFNWDHYYDDVVYIEEAQIEKTSPIVYIKVISTILLLLALIVFIIYYA